MKTTFCLYGVGAIFGAIFLEALSHSWLIAILGVLSAFGVASIYEKIYETIKNNK